MLISGGDPLTRSDDRIEGILREIRAIPHVEIIRIGTRVPLSCPRITDNLLYAEKVPSLWMNLQFNHPREITPSADACQKLADRHSLGSQSVLLKGINDCPYLWELDSSF